ncbi:MAG: glycosyltransferase family 39 protein [Chloroflexi bacterium]|nr:glycosyltransferase family 39 protein [Chloroflexota bacterium]
MRKKVLTAFLLVSILIYGGALRFVGQNWDDFSHTHPDERFLTLLVLPNLGGGNMYTEDEARFPEQFILVLRDSTAARSQEDILNQPDIQLGAVRDSFAVDASQWLAPQKRIQVFDDFASAQIALLARHVDALLVGRFLLPDSDAITFAESLSSVDLQSLRCRHYHPASAGVGGYFDTRCSPLNPHNAGHGFFAYGTFPLLLARFGSEFIRAATDADLLFFDFQGGHLVWRGFSMIFDILSILVVFAIGARIHNRWVGLMAAAFYAAAPLAIQKAHFGTVNAIASFFVILALYCAVRAQQRGRLPLYFFFGIACGTAVACRINLAPLAGVIVVSAAFQAMPAFDSHLSRSQRQSILVHQLAGLLLAGIGAFLAFRIFNPYAFNGPGVFGLLPNERWIANLAAAGRGATGLPDSPPNWQWVARSPFVYISRDLLFWGMGLSFGVLGWVGWAWSAYRILRNRPRATENLALIVWIGGYMLWMGRLWPMTMRYFLPLYGALAVMAGWGLFELYRCARNNRASYSMASWLLVSFGLAFAAIGGYQVVNGLGDATAISALVLAIALFLSAILPQTRKYRPTILAAFALGFALLWGLMFSNIYRHQTTLVQSSRYIFERIPGDFALEIEGANDRVPLINIAITDTGLLYPSLEGSPFDQATIYQEDLAQRASFIAPASGKVSTVFAPHLGDPMDDDQLEEVIIRIYKAGDSAPLAEANLTANLLRDAHPLGSSYHIPFSAPLQVEEGVGYEFEVLVAAGSGDVIGSGSVVLTEGDWDNRATGIRTCDLPDGLTLADDPPSGLVRSEDCGWSQAFYRLVNAQDQIMSYPVDNQDKYDNILRTLDFGDYLTIASNRFYDSEPRNLMRWPLTTLYYDKLFAGELGYELIAVFDESFEFGPWRVSDQHLPIYDSPGWLN